MPRRSEDDIPQHVLFTDFQAVLRLLGGVVAEGLPRAERVRQLMEGATRLLDGDVWIWWHGRNAPMETTRTYQIQDGGYVDDEQRDLFRQWVTMPEVHNHITLGAVRLMVEPLTVSRQEMARNAGREEGRTEILARDRSGLGDYLMTFYPLPDGNSSAAGIHRTIKKGLFGAREKMLFHTLMAELPDLRGGGRATPNEAVVNALSPRLKQVLSLVLEGHSRKQIAKDLALSEHTVGGYLKDLHTRLNVKSRGELMAHFMPD